MKVWRVAEKQAGNQDGRRRGAECRDRDVGIEPPHQLLEHEDGTRDRRVEGDGEPGPRTGSEERSAIRSAAAGNPADDMRHDGTHLHARPFAAKRQLRTDRQQPAEEFDRYQIGRRRRQLLIQRRIEMRDAAPGGVGRKPSDRPRRRRNRQPCSAGHQQEAAEPAVMGERDHPVAQAIGFLERQPECRTDQSAAPPAISARSANARRLPGFSAGRASGFDAGSTEGPNLSEQNDLANRPNRR